jgi:hypothetical protein
MHHAYNLMYLYGLMHFFSVNKEVVILCLLSFSEELLMLLISCSLEFTKEDFVLLKSMVRHMVWIQLIRT